MQQEIQLEADFFTPQPKSSNGQDPDSPSPKMSPAYSHLTRGSTLLQWLGSYVDEKYLFLEQDGQMPESHLGRKDSSNGEFWMRNIAEHRSFPEPFPSDAGVSSLSEILETGQVARRFFLTPKACKGILHRAENRGKALPMTLRRALLQVAEASTEPETPGDKTV